MYNIYKLTVISAVGLCNIIKDLLETNVRQRGNIGGSSVKLGRRIRELERIYDIHNGGNDKVTRSSNGTTGYTESDLANQLGIDLNTLKRAKSLTTLPTEIQDLIEQGRFPFWLSAYYLLS